MLFHLNCPKSQFVLAAFCKNAIMVNFSKSDPSRTRSSLWIIPTPLRLHFRFCFVGREWTKGWVINKRNGKPDSLEWCVLSGGLKGKGSSFPAAGSSSGRDVVGKYSWGESEKRNLAEKLSGRVFCGLADLSNSAFSYAPVTLALWTLERVPGWEYEQDIINR